MKIHDLKGVIMKKKIVFAILIMTFILSSCSSDKNAMHDEAKADYGSDAYEKAEEDMLIEVDTEEEGIDNSLKINENIDNSNLNRNQMEENRKIIKTGYISIESQAYDESVLKLRSLINKNNGYVFSSNEYDGNEQNKYDDKWSSYVIKVPAENFDSFMNSAGSIGDLINKSEEKQDVSSRYMDIELRLKTLKVQEERLLDILEKADDLEKIVELERALSDVRYEIESFESSKRDLDRKVAYSTINVEINEIRLKEEYKEKPISFGEKAAYAFENSIENTGYFLQNLLLFLISALPAIIFLAIIIFIIVLIVKKINKKKAAKKPINTFDSVVNPDENNTKK